MQTKRILYVILKPNPPNLPLTHYPTRPNNPKQINPCLFKTRSNDQSSHPSPSSPVYTLDKPPSPTISTVTLHPPSKATPITISNPTIPYKPIPNHKNPPWQSKSFTLVLAPKTIQRSGSILTQLKGWDLFAEFKRLF